MQIEKYPVTKAGKHASKYELVNNHGTKIVVTDLGAAVVSIFVKDKNNEYTDVILGYDNAQGYEDDDSMFGECVGRNANRIGNAELLIGNQSYQLTKNDGEANLHSGTDFYKDRVWKLEHIKENEVTLSLSSPDKDQGFPGNLNIEVTYTITDQDEFKIQYHAIADKKTVVNMTNHSYFNLNGHDAGTIFNQKVAIYADAYTKTDEHLIPTGEIIPVENTPMDLRNGKLVKDALVMSFPDIKIAGGFDHNYVLNNNKKLVKAALAESDESGIHMEVYTDMPGIQFYTAGNLGTTKGKNGAVYSGFSGMCFETQFYPDTCHHANFPSSILEAREPYNHVTIYKFSTKER